MGFGGVVLDTAGQVMRINDTGMRLLRARQGKVACKAEDQGWSREAISSAVDAAERLIPRGPVGGASYARAANWFLAATLSQ
jgi:hypothetical protein